MLFSKIKTKLSLVDDYIFVKRIIQYYSFAKGRFDAQMYELFDGIVQYASKIEELLKECFLRLKMFDLSFEILNKQIEQTKNIIFAEKTLDIKQEIQKYHKNLQILKNMRQNLPQNLKKLSLNQSEINFILRES